MPWLPLIIGSRDDVEMAAKFLTGKCSCPVKVQLTYVGVGVYTLSLRVIPCLLLDAPDVVAQLQSATMHQHRAFQDTLDIFAILQHVTLDWALNRVPEVLRCATRHYLPGLPQALYHPFLADNVQDLKEPWTGQLAGDHGSGAVDDNAWFYGKFCC